MHSCEALLEPPTSGASDGIGADGSNRGEMHHDDQPAPPVPPLGRAGDRLRTLPGKGWFTLLRLHGPLEPRFARSWRPGEIELVS